MTKYFPSFSGFFRFFMRTEWVITISPLKFSSKPFQPLALQCYILMLKLKIATLLEGHKSSSGSRNSLLRPGQGSHSNEFFFIFISHNKSHVHILIFNIILPDNNVITEDTLLLSEHSKFIFITSKVSL